MSSIKLFFVKLVVMFLLSAFVTFASAQSVSCYPTLSFHKMRGIPTYESGYANGVSACFAGIIQDKVIMAGGCNFPEISAVNGGKKKFYSGIYVANLNANSILQWEKAGDLPLSAAYGVTIEDNNRLIFIGGANEKGGLSSVYSISFNANRTLKTETLPSLPSPLDNMAGAIIGKTVYVAGGKLNGKPSASMFYLNLDKLNDGWKMAPAIPGNPRLQAVMAAQSGNLYLWGGFAPTFDGKEPTLSTDGYKFSLKTNEWTKLVAPKDEQGEAVSLGGGVAIAMNDSLILCTGGVNKDIFFFEGLQREFRFKGEEAKLKAAEYLSKPVTWHQFNNKIFIYNTLRNKWNFIAKNPAVGRSGAALIGNKNTFYLINGEIKPGVRSAQITKISINNKPSKWGTN